MIMFFTMILIYPSPPLHTNTKRNPSRPASTKTGGGWCESSRGETPRADGSSRAPFSSGSPLDSPRQSSARAPLDASRNPFDVSVGEQGGAKALPPLPSRLQPGSSQRALVASSPRRSEQVPLEAVLAQAVGLLQQVGRAVAELDDAYNAAYNASTAADGWRGNDHDGAELGEVGGYNVMDCIVVISDFNVILNTVEYCRRNRLFGLGGGHLFIFALFFLFFPFFSPCCVVFFAERYARALALERLYASPPCRMCLCLYCVCDQVYLYTFVCLYVCKRIMCM